MGTPSRGGVPTCRDEYVDDLAMLVGGSVWSCAFSPNGTLLATAGNDLVIRLWDPGTGRLHGTLAAHTRRVWSVAFSPDSSMLASAGDDGTVRLWTSRTRNTRSCAPP
ncbi:WD40 repeat domain-containing protein [Micromonospora sp. NPDC050187]|uniref:WD40 repeat domain-containing protein n=1 Tax=Micromonospora sp. NPDC050187 TaxID=3364277 RepID=UPI0037AF0A66